ncbi:hypothetical protein DAMA08_053690 [Martiniozyma asiatica (nom. inval.)]|nr:hypothetical protein DAMA08_053690 [Martiniozyma asiatica]
MKMFCQLKWYTESNGTSLSMSWDEVGNKYWEPYDEEKERSNQNICPERSNLSVILILLAT